MFRIEWDHTVCLNCLFLIQEFGIYTNIVKATISFLQTLWAKTPIVSILYVVAYTCYYSCFWATAQFNSILSTSECWGTAWAYFFHNCNFLVCNLIYYLWRFSFCKAFSFFLGLSGQYKYRIADKGVYVISISEMWDDIYRYQLNN